MRNISTAAGVGIKYERTRSRRTMSYQEIAGSLASTMAGFIKPGERGRLCPPYKLVILSDGGLVVFECEVGEDWKIQRGGIENRVQRSHFPATALLTDHSLVTRTFRIERMA
jgi:hypothetical protein